MNGVGLDQLEAIDYALAAYREQGTWRLGELADPALESVETLAHSLRRFPGDAGALGLVAVDEDFFVLVRVQGNTPTGQVSVLLSDVTAALEWELAESVVDFLGLPVPDEDDEGPAGDLGILADLGMSAIDMGVLLDDPDAYPDEMLSEIAAAAGFGPEFDEAVGLDAL